MLPDCETVPDTKDLKMIEKRVIQNETGGDNTERQEVPKWFHQVEFSTPDDEGNLSAHCGSGCGGACGKVHKEG